MKIIDKAKQRVLNLFNVSDNFGRKSYTESKNFAGIGLNIRAVSRSSKDVGDWKKALEAAERKYNPNRALYYDICYNNELDEDYQTAMSKRKAALLNLDMTYNVNDNIDEDVTEWINSPVFRKFKSDILNSIYWGYELFEFYFDDITMRQFGNGAFYKQVPFKHVQPNRKEILVNQYDYRGKSYKDLIAITLMEVGDVDDLGLMNRLSAPIIYKRNGVSDWAQYAELAGNNFRMVTYTGSDQKLRKDVSENLENVGSAGILELPDGINIDSQQNSSGSSNQLFENFDKRMSNSIHKIITGQSALANSEKEGSFAKSKTMLQVEESIYRDDRVFLLGVLNESFKHFLPKFGFKDNGKFVMEDVSFESLEERIKNDLELSKLIPFKIEYFAEKYGIPEDAIKIIKKNEDKD